MAGASSTETHSQGSPDMRFKNTKTGVILNLPDDFTGKNWEPVDKAPKTPHIEEPKEEPKKPTKKKKEV